MYTTAPEGFARGRNVRLGAYGDPAAVPFAIWAGMLEGSSGNTGYTHQWRTCDARFASIVMASCDFEWEVAKAERKGYRAFAPVKAGTEFDKRTNMHCPAAKETGFKRTCDSCMQCGGTSSASRKHVVIFEH